MDLMRILDVETAQSTILRRPAWDEITVPDLLSDGIAAITRIFQAFTAKSRRPDRGLRNADRAAGDLAGIVPEFPGDRCEAAAAELGKPRRGRAGRAQSVSIALVAVAVSVCAAGVDTAGNEPGW